MKVAILGAESTGKTELSRGLADALQARGASVTLVPEVLREWCEATGRVPVAHEQLPIAREQARRADEARTDTATNVLIADTGPLMIAVYSDMIFGDTSLYAMAFEHQRGYDLTLVTGIDLPWVADGLRDGPHAQEPADRLLRAALARAGIPFKVIYGQGPARLANALAAVDAVAYARAVDVTGAGRKDWAGLCDKCGDPDCEHRLFTGLLRSKAVDRPAT